MATYLTDSKLAKPLAGEEGWGELFDYNWELLSTRFMFKGFHTSVREVPSDSLYVYVAGGQYIKSDSSLSGVIGGNILLPAEKSITLFINCLNDQVEFFDNTGSGPLEDSFAAFPESPHVPLALIHTGATVITSVSDWRAFGLRVYTQLTNAANDAAAASAGVAVNCLYRNGSVQMIRVS